MSLQPMQNHHEGAYLQMMRGLRELDLLGSGVPSDLVLIGDHAFPLAMNSRGQVMMAVSLYGKGRIIVLGHESYLKAFPALIENALFWLRGDQNNNLSVGIQKNAMAFVTNLNKAHFQVKEMRAFSDKSEVGVYVTDAYSVGADHKDLVAFMKAGGGVLIAGQAWSWAESYPKKNTLLQFEGNKVSGVAGIYFSDHQCEKEVLPVYPQIPSSWMSVVLGKDFEDDLEFLLKGISEFDLKGGALFSDILVHGPLAFPIGITEKGQTFLAGAYYGQGRVIVMSHEGFVGAATLGQFWNNVIYWLDEGRQGTIGIAHDPAFKGLSKSGLKCEKTKFRKDLSVFVCTAYSDNHAEEIVDFVAEGGGLLIGGHAWYWAQTHQGKSPLKEFPGNKILNKMGLSLLGETIAGGLYKTPKPNQAIKDTYHFRHLLHCFAGHVTQGENLTQEQEKHLQKLGKDCSTYLSMNAPDCCQYAQVLSTLTDVVKRSGMPQVNENCPVKSAKDHVLLSVGSQLFKVCPNPDALLPYLIKDNPLMAVVYNHRINVTVHTEGWVEWISTGLYLSPGMKTYLAIPAEMVNNGWKIQIGCQTDTLNHKNLKRAPCVHERFPITKEMMQVWNLWGGLIYLVTPKKTQVNDAVIIVQMAVPAPYYRSGVTTPAEWSLLCTAPSPWAELEFDNIILTVPSDVVRNLDHPDELAEHWNTIMRAIADLAAKPHKFKHKERIVTDVQISHGKCQFMCITTIPLIPKFMSQLDHYSEKMLRVFSLQQDVKSLKLWLTLSRMTPSQKEMEMKTLKTSVRSKNPNETSAEMEQMVIGIYVIKHPDADADADADQAPEDIGIIVEDVQVLQELKDVTRWMHAGYPIMMHKPTASELVSIDFAKKRGLWGPIHELGHNQQRSCWEFPSHTTECTCNLWSVYVHEEVFGINREKAHEAMRLEGRKKRIREYVNGGRDLSKWSMFVALETYMQLQEKFGWDAFKKVFAAYHEMSNFPKGNKDKMNLYAETFSKIVGMNLTGFFKAWGWPIEKATEKKISNLPCWSDHPMVHYD